MITVSSPGKVHLMGEHAVVYGKPALLAAINLRTQVSVEENSTGFKIVSTESPEYVQHAAEFLTETYKLNHIPMVTITITSNIPAGFHLGSSAAVAVGVVGALTYFVKKTWNPVVINQLAYEIEKKQHGNPSGGDNTVVAMGGFVWFRRELEFLKSMWQLPFRLPTHLNHFFLIDTGRPRENTGEMVAFVGSKFKTQRSEFTKLFHENEEQTKKMAKALKEGNESELIDSMKKGERTLESMGVVSKKAVTIIRQIEASGGAAKILGGGGRKDGVGFLLCYANQMVTGATRITLGEEGVRLESKS